MQNEDGLYTLPPTPPDTTSNGLYYLPDTGQSTNAIPQNQSSSTSSVDPQTIRTIVSAQLANFTDTAVIKLGFLQSGNFVSGSTGWQLTPTGAQINGGVSVTSLNIPDQTTANSFHTDSSGNSWWGANVATGYTGATAYILATGAASFKNILIGGATYQFQVVNAGIFSFGDGSDGAGVADGVTALAGASLAGSTYTLTREVSYTDLTVSTGVTINPAGYRIFGQGTLTLNGTATIKRNGNAGNNAGGAPAAGTGGTALADGYLKGSAIGGNGGAGGDNASGGGVGTAGGNGATTANSLGSIGIAGGNGGNGGSGHAAGGGGSAGTWSQYNVKLIANWHLTVMLDVGSTGSTVKYDNSSGAGGGGGGGSGDSGAAFGGGGGGGGSAGGIIGIYFRNIVIGASAFIQANGGNGGNGGTGLAGGGANGGGGGGGGSGGNGGQIILVYNTLTNSGTLQATGGTKGTKGLKGGNGLDGSDGTNGTAGTIRQFQVTM